MKIDTTKELVESVFEKTKKNIKIVRERLKRPLTLTEKVLLGHLYDPHKQELNRGESFLLLNPDRVLMQDVTGQMAILQFMSTGKKNTEVPTTVHCDHLIPGQFGTHKDLKMANDSNKEVFDFLRSACSKYGIGFWGPGSGIIHQVALENYVFPGGMMIGTDSHTVNAGGLGMIACGVGGMDAVDVMAGMPWEVKFPKVLGVRLLGNLEGWASPKDIILKLLGILTVKGGTNKIVEYFGEGASSLSATGKATVTNMGAELGATTSVFPYDGRIKNYLDATERGEILEVLDRNKEYLQADPEVLADPENHYDEIVEINLSTLEPQIVGPHSPDLARPISALKEEAKEKGYPLNLTAALVGSCTNSSYEDLKRSANVAKQAIEKGIKAKSTFTLSPGSARVFETIKRDGIYDDFEKIGAVFYTNSCGPCIGQWIRTDGVKKGDHNSIVTSFNRNFPARNDGNPETRGFIASPEIVVAMGLSGRLDFDPLNDELTDQNGQKFKLNPPEQVDAIPEEGFVSSKEGYLPPESNGSSEVIIDPNSNRLQKLAPFLAWDGKDFNELPVLIKVKGKCTTDHISPAGPWLKFRGHLDKISDNALLGAVNAYTEIAGETLNQQTGQRQSVPEVARSYKNAGVKWVIVGDENYGEGSSREHAAMCPRFLGAVAVIVRSFARIHETNLKKQGILPFTFSNPNDYDLIKESDKISISDLASLEPKKDVVAAIIHQDGSRDEIKLCHTMNKEQIGWFKAGSALNILGN